MANQNRPSIQSRNRQYISGIKKRFTALSSIPIAGTTYTPAALIALYQEQIDATDAIVPAGAAWHKAVTAARDATARVRAVRVGFEQFVRATFGNDEQALGDFGLLPKKPPVVKPAVQVAAAEKAAATRKARGTTGKKKKLAVKGTVTPPPPPATPPAK
ncbi:MAG TPA: hypothetical protein VIF15_01165 [Polyangiaceae bacterium]|jgi:hypothetical protein